MFLLFEKINITLTRIKIYTNNGDKFSEALTCHFANIHNTSDLIYFDSILT